MRAPGVACASCLGVSVYIKWKMCVMSSFGLSTMTIVHLENAKDFLLGVLINIHAPS